MTTMIIHFAQSSLFTWTILRRVRRQKALLVYLLNPEQFLPRFTDAY